MIDTIKLTLDSSMFATLGKNQFAKEKQNSAQGYYTMVQNPTKSELKQGIYKPRLTFTHRFNCTGKSGKTLSIEFSIPKLMIGNTFDELTGNEFPKILQKLHQALNQMDVRVYEQCLINAPISSVHYSKNIALTDYTTPYTYLEQLSKLNINQNLDTDRTSFRNEGHSFKYRANSFEVAFYDKLKDLQQGKKSKKRAEEKDNAIQLNLLDLIDPKKPFEVIRIEIRLNKRQKIRHLLKSINNEVEPTFVNIFNQSISKKVLLHYIAEIENASSPLLTYQQDTPKKLFNGLLIANPDIKLKKLLTMYGLKSLIDDIGVRGFRQLTKRHGNSVWYSLNKEMKQLKTTNEPVVFSLLRKEITAFKPLRLVDFQDKMINNDKYN